MKKYTDPEVLKNLYTMYKNLYYSKLSCRIEFEVIEELVNEI